MERKVVSKIMVTLLLSSVLTLSLNIQAVTKADPDWLSGWNHRKSLVISSASGAGTNYQIMIKAHYGNGTDIGQNVYLSNYSRADFGDVRFTDDDGTTELDYWMEEKVDGEYAIFWVEVADDLSFSDAIIYIYYGKLDELSTSNGENTFIFFDDFPGSSLNTSKWTLVNGSVGIANSNLEITGTTGTRGKIISNSNFSIGKALRSRAKGNDTTQWAQRWNTLGATSGGLARNLEIYGMQGNNSIRYTTRNPSGMEQTTTIIPNLADWSIFETDWTSGRAAYLVDDISFVAHTSYVPETDLDIRFCEANVACGTVYTDWILLRKNVYPEPRLGSYVPTPIIFEDDFESYAVGSFPSAGGWELWTNGAGTTHQVIVDSFSVSPSKSLQLRGKPSWVATASKRYTAESIQVGFEVYVRINELEGMDGSIARVAFSVRPDPLHIRFYSTVHFGYYDEHASIVLSGYGELQSFVAGEWYKIKQIVDRSSDTCSVWINDVLKASNVKITTNDTPEVDAHAHYNDTEALTLCSSYANINVYFDDVKIFQSARAYPSIYIDPSITVGPTLTLGKNFTISIKTDYNGTDIQSYQFTLFYNPSVLHGVEVTNGDIITTDKHPSATFLPGTFDNTAGELSLTAAFFFFVEEPAPLTSGPGTLANVTFTVVGNGTSSITVGPETVLFGYTEGGYGEPYHIINAETMPDHIQHGYFNNAGPPPPPPPPPPGSVISLNPVESTIQLGDSFTIDVNVADVTDLGCWSIELSYNTTILDAISVSPTPDTANNTDWVPVDAEGVFHPDGPPAVNDAMGRVMVGALIPVPQGQGLTGSFTLLTINFTATEAGECALDLYDTVLGDSMGNAISHTTLDGSVTVDSGAEVYGVAVTNVLQWFNDPPIRVMDAAYSTWPINLNVTVENVGSMTVSCNVTVYYNSIEIATQTVTDLVAGEIRILTLIGNITGLDPGHNPGVYYTLKANATTICFPDLNLADNEFVYGQVKIRRWGDVDNSDAINILDVKKCKLAYSDIIDEPFADIDGNCPPNILDIKLIQLIYSGYL